jgi:hypothetical protein
MSKQISINPDLFSVGRTRKKREKKQKPEKVPLISPNVLKNKLLKRIKEHKIKETEGLDNNKKKLPQPNSTSAGVSTSASKPNLVDLSDYTDEFNDSINYLQTLSKQKKENDEKVNVERNKQRLKDDLERRTVKNYQSLLSSPTLASSSNLPHVNIELPEELKQQLIDVNTTQFVMNALNSQVTAQSPIVLSQPYKVDNGLPYGCLKNGIKPGYKEWNKTQRNMVVTNPNLSVVIDPNISSNISERENRLQNLKNKIKEKQLVISNTNTNTNTINIEEGKQGNPVVFEENTSLEVPKIATETINNPETVEPYKQILKRTIRKKYTLGKTKNNRTVGILIKDRNTRKQVLTAQRELKKKSVNDIKTYLKDHNLIKVGSNAPNDVLRKMYEASMLAGEITNSNSDTLLHNLLKDDKEL